MFTQCSLPVFVGLFPQPHSKIIDDLIFFAAYWHGLAKLRVHTTQSVRLLEAATTKLGRALRKFQTTTCADIRTTELPKETQSRLRQEAHQVALRHSTNSSSTVPQKRKRQDEETTRRRVLFSLSMYKLHALGDYATFVRKFGTTDSYTTQTVCLCLSLAGISQIYYSHL